MYVRNCEGDFITVVDVLRAFFDAKGQEPHHKLMDNCQRFKDRWKQVRDGDSRFQEKVMLFTFALICARPTVKDVELHTLARVISAYIGAEGHHEDAQSDPAVLGLHSVFVTYVPGFSDIYMGRSVA